MSPVRMTALVAGVLYLVTFIAGIPPSFLYEPVFSNPDYIVSAADATRRWRSAPSLIS
jgi:hypothetical protein